MSEKKRKGYADTFTEYASEFAGPSIKPSMTISSKRGELKSPPKVEFKLKKKKKISKEEWDGPKIKIKKKKSGGHRKQVNK